MKICIVHFRLGLTDGVSLQIDERVRILRQLGHEVFLIGDDKSPIADLMLPYFNYKQNEDIVDIQEKAFKKGDTTLLRYQIEEIATKIEEKIEQFWATSHFSFVFIHNIFALPVCLPATVALYRFLRKHPEIKGVGMHHDFYWDPERKGKYNTHSVYVKEVLENYFPPKLSNLDHTVLSKWEQEMLYKLKEIKSYIISDTFDFEQAPWGENATNKDFCKDVGIEKDDIVLLLASRIRQRKGIELGVEFANSLARVTSKKVVLVLPNDFSPTESKYIKLLKASAAKLDVKVLWIQDLVGSEEEKKKGLKQYSLWDCYVYATAILYPSTWEGFGNQFLEAVFAKKPIVASEYPIYKTDLKPAGFEIVSIPEKISFTPEGLVHVEPKEMDESAKQLMTILTDPIQYKSMVEHNFMVGKKKFNTLLQLRQYLTEKSEKYFLSEGIRSPISPLLLSGKLIASGVLMQRAYALAETIIDDIPGEETDSDTFFSIVANHLPYETKMRYVTIELVKQYLVSPKNTKPLFIFLGGLAGKTILANAIVQNLNIDQSVALDNEKKHIATPGKSKKFFVKATYESQLGYIKTVDAMFPKLSKMIERYTFDFNKYKKWCYFWEGIYLSSNAVKRLHDKYNGNIRYLSVFNLPLFSDIKNQYILRWQNELGIEKLKTKKNLIDNYLKNVSAIRSHITDNLDPIASFVIESPILEERLSIFYVILYQRLKDIADEELPGWVEKVVADPTKIRDFKAFLCKH